jgi:hypothetical protein
LYALGEGYFTEKGFPIVTVPSCKRCNNWLGDKSYHSIRQRKGFIASRLKTSLDAILACPKWSDDEIEEMGRFFQDSLRDRENFREYGKRLIAWSESDFPWDNI